MSTRPPIDAAVVLERAGASWLEGEVAAYDESDVLVALRTETVDVGDLPVPVTMVWHTDQGIFCVQAAAQRHGEHYRVRLLDETDRVQRREYMRLPMGTAMTLSCPGWICRATLVDISEAALRARVEARPAAGFEAGAEVRAAFNLHRTGFMLRGRVLREQPGDSPDSIEVVVTLDIPARTANDLRRNVVFEQAGREQPGRGQARHDQSRREQSGI